MAQLAVDELVVGDLDLDEAGDLGLALVGEAALGQALRTQAHQDLGVVHDVGLLVVVHVGDDGLGHADLVGGQAHGVLEGGQGVQEVLGQGRVLGRGGGAGLGEDGFVVDEVLDHGRSFLADA